VSYNRGKIELIFNLLRQTTSISVVSNFLAGKNLNHSAGSWDDLFSKRIIPALDKHELTEDDFLDLLRSAEEHGKQHIFLFKCSAAKAKDLLDENLFLATAKKHGLLSLLTKPTILDQPSQPTIADLRFGQAEAGGIVLKEVEKRIKQIRQGEEKQGSNLVVTYRLESRRAVNVVRLSRDGMLEVRVASYDSNSPKQYENDVTRLFGLFQPFIGAVEFNLVSLDKAKRFTYKNAAILGNKIRFSNITIQNDDDTRITASVGTSDANLLLSTAIQESLNNYSKHEGHFASSNFYFLPTINGPSKETHVVISGQPNEFTIPVSCNRADYEYILNQIRSYNT
jgi:hypothetical protein